MDIDRTVSDGSGHIGWMYVSDHHWAEEYLFAQSLPPCIYATIATFWADAHNFISVVLPSETRRT
jgi:hypothetical protein